MKPLPCTKAKKAAIAEHYHGLLSLRIGAIAFVTAANAQSAHRVTDYD